MKRGDAQLRNRFVKELERFLRRSLAAASDPAASWQKLCAIVCEGGAKLDLLQKPEIYNPYFVEMTKIATELRARASLDDGEVAEVSAWLAKSLNSLEKLRREKSYSRAKTRKMDGEDWE